MIKAIQRIPALNFRVYNRALRITREGWFLTGLTFAVGAAAINTGNNLMYLVLGMTLSVMVISGILSENVLKSIQVERRMPAQAWATVPFEVDYVLHNPKRMMPSYSLRVNEKGIRAASEAFVLKLAAGENKVATGRFISLRRGLLRFTEARILTQFPFGLFEKTKLVKLGDTIVIFPFPILNEQDAKSAAEWGSEDTGLVKGEGTGLFGLRDYMDGDNPRRIHWKVSAREDKLILRETEAMDLPMITLVLDSSNYRPGRDDDALEPAISRCAGFAKHFIENGYMVRLITGMGELPYGSGHPHLRRMMTHLALFEPKQAPAPNSGIRPGEAHIVIGLNE